MYHQVKIDQVKVVFPGIWRVAAKPHIPGTDLHRYRTVNTRRQSSAFHAKESLGLLRLPKGGEESTHDDSRRGQKALNLQAHL